jgi:hypothetical protein
MAFLPEVIVTIGSNSYPVPGLSISIFSITWPVKTTFPVAVIPIESSKITYGGFLYSVPWFVTSTETTSPNLTTSSSLYPYRGTPLTKIPISFSFVGFISVDVTYVFLINFKCLWSCGNNLFENGPIS